MRFFGWNLSIKQMRPRSSFRRCIENLSKCFTCWVWHDLFPFQWKVVNLLSTLYSMIYYDEGNAYRKKLFNDISIQSNESVRTMIIINTQNLKSISCQISTVFILFQYILLFVYLNLLVGQMQNEDFSSHTVY